jgi:hypothetical protein
MILITFALFYLWQPFFGGIYSDDWGFLLSYFTENDAISSPFSFDRLSHFMKVYANRPISGVMFYLVNSIAGYNITMVHSIMLVEIYISAFSIYKLGSAFINYLKIKNSNFYGALAATIWLISPWTLGITAWYSSSINLVSLIFFSFSIYYVFKSLEVNKNYYFSAGILYLLSSLTYESFFFQYSSFLLIIWFLSKDNRENKRKVINFFILFSTLLILTIVWNRLTANLFEASIHKALNPYFLQTLAFNIISFPYVILKGFGDLFIPATIIIISVLGYLLFKLKQNSGTIKSLIVNNRMKIILTFGLGILLSVFMYSAAGYTLWALGSRSRTMFVVSFYIPFILIIFWNWIKKDSIIIVKFRSILVVILCIITLNSYLTNKIDWIQANEIQKEITTNIPQEISNLGKESMVIFVGPYRHEWISVIDAPWAINFQMKYGESLYKSKELEPYTKARFVSGTGVIHPAKNKNYQLYWDGDSLTIGYNLEEIAYNSGAHVYYDKMEKFEAKQLYIWDYSKQSLTKISDPQLFEYPPFKNYDYWVTWLYHNWIKN